MSEIVTERVSTAPKRTRRKEARPGEIIAAGIAEFAEHGFERARLDRIAKAAGVAKGTIYLYFENKEALFMAAVEEYVLVTMTETEVELEMGDDLSTTDLITRMIGRAYAKMTAQEPLAIMRILVAEGHRFPHLMATYHNTVIARGTDLIKRLLERGVKRGEFPESPVTRIPEIIVAPVMFMAMNRMTFADLHPLDQDDFREAHIQMVLSALGLKSCAEATA